MLPPASVAPDASASSALTIEALGEFGVPAVADDDPNVGEFHDTGSSIEDGDHAQQQPDRVGVEDDSD